MSTETESMTAGTESTESRLLAASGFDLQRSLRALREDRRAAFEAMALRRARLASQR